jgi:hypothetical protein
MTQKPATLGMVNLETMEFIPLITTRAWNFQQGCMVHWLAISSDSLIINNDLRDGKYPLFCMCIQGKK